MAVTTAVKLSQLSFFSSINRQFHAHRRSIAPIHIRPKSFLVKCADGRGAETASSEDKTTLSYASDFSKQYVEEAKNPHTAAEESCGGKINTDEPADGEVVKQKKAAKIHDFCFGIPYGGLVLSSGLLGFIFSRNLTTLSTGVLYGGALLALSSLSLKIWRQGKSSLPFILGQAVLSGILFWRNFEAYSLTKRLIPAGLYAAISAAMLCFYCYVVLSGGNPPPKKLKSVAPAPS